MAIGFNSHSPRLLMFGKESLQIKLTTGQKFDNFPPGSKIEALEVGN
jgi:hypothetical protein